MMNYEEKKKTADLLVGLNNFLGTWKEKNIFSDELIVNAAATFAALQYMLNNEKSVKEIANAASSFSDHIKDIILTVCTQLQKDTGDSNNG